MIRSVALNGTLIANAACTRRGVTTSAVLLKKEKGKVKKSSAAKTVDQDLVDPVDLRSEFDEQAKLLREDFAKQLSLRTNIQTFESLKVDLPEGKFPLNHLGKVTMKNPKLVVVNLSASPGATQHVMDALVKSGLGVTPQQQGNTVYIQVPLMSREQREKMAHSAKNLLRNYDTNLGHVARKFVKAIDKAEVGGHDAVEEIYSARMLVQEEKKRYMHEAEALLKQKQQELLEEIK